MDVELILEEPHEGPEEAARRDADQDHQRLGQHRAQPAVTHEGGRQEPGRQHLPGDADIEEARLEAHHEAQRRQDHGRQHVQEGEEVRQHPGAAAVVRLRPEARPLQEALEGHQRVLSEDQQDHAGAEQAQKDREQGDIYGGMAVFVQQGREFVQRFVHASFTPII